MLLKVVGKAKLYKPPTAICQCFNRIYIATKGKRVFFTEDMHKFKSILFTSQVNSLSCSENLLFCSQENGCIFALNEKHKSALKMTIGESKSIHSIFDCPSDQFFIGSANRKITVFGADSILKTSYFINETPLIYFDISNDNILAGISENESNIQFINLKNKEKSQLKIIDGFPEILKFLKSDTLIVGTSAGVLSCFSTVNYKRTSYLKFKTPLTALHVLNPTLILAGTHSFLYLIDFSNFNKMEIVQEIPVDGIPIDFCGKESIYCVISRESRLGRWKKDKKGHNHVIHLDIE